MISKVKRQCLVIEHLAIEHAGSMRYIIESFGYDVTSVAAASLHEMREEAASADLLIVMGGPIGVYDESDFIYLATELSIIKLRLEARKAVLGICLGCQLLAKAAGGAVYKGAAGFEIGWSPIELTNAGQLHAISALGQGENVLHWHGDTFDLPEGATLLASSRQYSNQAFAIAEYALGLQFHIEVNDHQLEQWLVAFAGDLRKLQQPTFDQLRIATRHHQRQMAERTRIFLQSWIRQLPQAGSP